MQHYEILLSLDPDNFICSGEKEWFWSMTSHAYSLMAKTDSVHIESAYLIQRRLPRPLLDLGKDHRVHGGQAPAHRPRRVKRGGEIDEWQNACHAKVEPPQHQETRPVRSVWGMISNMSVVEKQHTTQLSWKKDGTQIQDP